MSLELYRRFTATTVIFAVIAFVVVSPAWAGTNAVFTGKVLESDQRTLTWCFGHAASQMRFCRRFRARCQATTQFEATK